MKPADVFEEWNAYAEREVLFPRNFDSDLIIRTTALKNRCHHRGPALWEIQFPDAFVPEIETRRA